MLSAKNPTETSLEMGEIRNSGTKGEEIVLFKLIKDDDEIGLTQYLEKLQNEEAESLIFEQPKEVFGRTALHEAANHENLDLALKFSKILVDNVRDSTKKTELIKLKKDDQGRTALMYSAARGNWLLMEYLLGNDSDPKAQDNINRTVLHFMAKCDDRSKATECATKFLNLSVFSADLNSKADFINTRTEEDDYKRSALHMAAINGNHELMQLLIQNGADVQALDTFGYTVLHHAAFNAYPDNAENCTKAILDEKSVEESTKTNLINMRDGNGRAPIHLAARRGNHLVLKCLKKNGVNELLKEKDTLSTSLHLAASLGNEEKASYCVAELLNTNLTARVKEKFVNEQDKDKFTALYLSAKHRNVDACKHLLTAGSKFDKKTSHGKTPLEKVYKKIPEAVNALLDKAVETSGYENKQGSVNIYEYVSINFDPILGNVGNNKEYTESTDKENLYKETEELGKIQFAKCEQRKDVLHHAFVKIYIWKKWQKIRWIFYLARAFNMLWFLSIFGFLVTNYRINCPFMGSKDIKFSWTALRPAEKNSGEVNVTSKALKECYFSGHSIVWGGFNIFGLVIFLLGLSLQTYDRWIWFYKPLKNKDTLDEQTTFDKPGIVFILHYSKVFLKIFLLPFMSAIMLGLVLIITIPVFGLYPFGDELQYYIFGVMGFIVWFGFYLEFGKIPQFRIYTKLLGKVTTTLGWAIFIHLPILFGFATTFVLFMQWMPSFSSSSQAVVKVLTLMIGELDYEGLFYGEEGSTGNLLFAGIEMFAFAIFILLVAVLLLNYLIALAADEIKDFHERAEVWRLSTQIEQICMLESFLNLRCCAKFLKKKLVLMPIKKHQERRLRVYIRSLPKELQRSIHKLNLKPLPEKKSN